MKNFYTRNFPYDTRHLSTTTHSYFRLYFSYFLSFRHLRLLRRKAVAKKRHKKSPQNSSAGTLLFTSHGTAFRFYNCFRLNRAGYRRHIQRTSKRACAFSDTPLQKVEKRPKALFYLLRHLQQVQQDEQFTSANVASTKAFSNFFQALMMYFILFLLLKSFQASPSLK